MSARAKPKPKHSNKLTELLLYPFGKGIIGGLIAIAVLGVMLGVGLYAFTNPARPGEPLFVLDRAFERFRISTSLSDTARFKRKIIITNERLEELLSFELDEVDTILIALDELEYALQDVQAEMAQLDEFAESRESSYQVVNNLLELIARYRAFLLGEDDDTNEIQKKLNESVEEINDIVSTVQQSNPAAPVLPVTPTKPSPSPSPGTSPAPTTPEPDPGEDGCDTTYQNLGNEIEREGVTLHKNQCDEYTVTFGGTTYVLITSSNLDNAVGKKVKYHGESGTNNSIFLTEFELDN